MGFTIKNVEKRLEIYVEIVDVEKDGKHYVFPKYFTVVDGHKAVLTPKDDTARDMLADVYIQKED